MEHYQPTQFHCRVLDTRKMGQHIVHITDAALNNGDLVWFSKLE